MTELAHIQDSDIEVLPPARPAQSEAIGQLMQHAAAMSSAKQLADVLCDTDLVPVTYKGKPGNGAAAILYGAELGLNPIQSLQQIFVVHGTPAIYARTAVALLKRHGLIVETVSSTNDAVTVKATDPRTGQVEQSTWDIPRADVAGYTSNKKYKTDPQAMLYAKAAMEVCRKIAPDVLLGVSYSREELDLEQQQAPRKVASSRRGVDGLRQAITPPQPVEVVEQPSAPPESAAAQPALSKSARTKWVKAMFAALNEGGCTDRDDQLAAITALAGRDPEDAPEHRDGITDEELKAVVGILGDWKKDGQQLFIRLGGFINTPPDPAQNLTAAEIFAERNLTGQEAIAYLNGSDGSLMATDDQLDDLARIQSEEKYDDESWFAFIESAVGVTVTANKDLTEAQATQLIDLFDNPAVAN